jgi:tetratricopeptide (TPR) repeat protein
MKNIFTALLFFISISLFSQETEKRLALVIGNSNYDKGELKNPVNDARLIASTLDSLDFDVILKENLSSKSDMTAAIREFGSKRSEYDVAFVYYAGHGVQVDDENFLLPTKETFEEEFDVLDYGVSVQNIMRYLKAQSNEVNILILDACRDNPFESNWNTNRSLKGGGLAKIPPPTGSLIAFSTDSGQTAPDGKGDNSVFTLSLSKNILLENTSIDQVLRNVRADVLQKTNGKQRPIESSQLTGDEFYINPSNNSKTFHKIDQLLINKEIDSALRILNVLKNKFPNDKRIYTKRGHINLIKGFDDNAKEDYLMALEIDPNYNEAKISTIDQFDSTELEVGLHRALDDKETEDFYKRLIKNNPNSYYPNIYFARYLSFQKGESKKAIEYLNNINRLIRSGLLLSDFKSISNNEKDLSKDINITLLNNYGYFYEKLEMYYESIDYFKKASRLMENINNSKYDYALAWAYYMLGNINLQIGNIKDGDKYFYRGAEILETSIPYYNRAVIYRNKKQYSKAISFYKKAISVMKQNKKAENLFLFSFELTETYMINDDLIYALQEINKLIFDLERRTNEKSSLESIYQLFITYFIRIDIFNELDEADLSCEDLEGIKLYFNNLDQNEQNYINKSLLENGWIPSENLINIECLKAK